jgi:hypothetical protein
MVGSSLPESFWHVANGWWFCRRLSPVRVLSRAGTRRSQPNLSVNMDAHGCPLPSVAPSRGRQLRLR